MPRVMGGLMQGHLKLHLQRAHLEHHRGPEFERMSPFVRIIHEGREIWKSVHKEREGRNPEWGFAATFEWEVVNPDSLIRIEVIDHAGFLNNEPVAHCEVAWRTFCLPGGWEDSLELFFRAHAAGRIFFKSEFRPQDVIDANPLPFVQPI